MKRAHDTETRVAQFRHGPAGGLPQGAAPDALAERFGLPVITLVDTAGAYPGIGAEERGQAEAIARSIETCLDVQVPLSRWSSARAAPAAPSRWPRPTAC
jgi:acetyl-CoA carboxylase carboxyl transferase subunit alpha